MGFPSPMMGRFGSNQMDPRNAGAVVPGENPFLRNFMNNQMMMPSPNQMPQPSGFPGMYHPQSMPPFGMPHPGFF